MAGDDKELVAVVGTHEMWMCFTNQHDCKMDQAKASFVLGRKRYIWVGSVQQLRGCQISDYILLEGYEKTRVTIKELKLWLRPVLESAHGRTG